jgi:alkylation response protein AidB-like acyl-CoA dehydrogenase
MTYDESDVIVQLRDTIRRFVTQEMPRKASAQWDRDNHFLRDVFDKLAQLGVPYRWSMAAPAAISSLRWP